MSVFSTEERREFERIDVSFPVEIEPKKGAKRIKAEARNICGAGMAVVLKKKIPLKDDVRLILQIPDNRQPYSIYGKVAWVQDAPEGQNVLGVGFHSVDLFRLWRIFRLPEVRKPMF
ncbi:MAG: PilZ domain-containing protein [Candidatus Gygaella obscura]|nr:PilZ domain-containing protein [Candidatus Gygaella obscura]